jgi:putative protein kinase ArgK-like GTPase of G3E family
MLSMAAGVQGTPAWETPVIPTIATDGSGFVELSAAISQHHEYLVEQGLLERKRIGRIRESLLARTMNDLALQAQEVELQQDVAVKCAAGELSEDEACDLIRDAIKAGR